MNSEFRKKFNRKRINGLKNKYLQKIKEIRILLSLMVEIFF